MSDSGIAYIRSRLESWGIWASFEETLPARARLRRGGAGELMDDVFNEQTHSAVVFVRNTLPTHYKLIKRLYIPDSDGRTAGMHDIFTCDRAKQDIGFSGKRDLYRMREEAERNIAAYLAAMSDVINSRQAI